tara:strand:+ start:2340 stop:2462 length:123 start_codon:yes stop_codon:yes gene_type:complete
LGIDGGYKEESGLLVGLVDMGAMGRLDMMGMVLLVGLLSW